MCSLAQHIEQELLSDQLGPESRRERRCREKELEVIERPLYHQMRQVLK